MSERDYGDWGPSRIYDDASVNLPESLYARMGEVEEALDGADEDTLRFTTSYFPSRVRLSRWTRLREWWYRRRRSRKVQDMLDEVARREDERLLYGDDLENSEWLREDY